MQVLVATRTGAFDPEDARAQGVPVLGVCLYPVLDYAGWDNDRCCDVGLLTAPDDTGRRQVCESLQEELERQQRMIETARALREPRGCRALPYLG